MEPSLAFIVIQALVKYGPEAAKAIRDMLKRNTFTDQEFDALFVVIEKPGEDYFAPQVKP